MVRNAREITQPLVGIRNRSRFATVRGLQPFVVRNHLLSTACGSQPLVVCNRHVWVILISFYRQKKVADFAEKKSFLN